MGIATSLEEVNSAAAGDSNYSSQEAEASPPAGERFAAAVQAASAGAEPGVGCVIPYLVCIRATVCWALLCCCSQAVHAAFC